MNDKIKLNEKKVLELSKRFQTLRIKYKELDSKAEALHHEASLAAEAADLAFTSLIEVQQTLLAASANIPLEEYLEDFGLEGFEECEHDENDEEKDTFGVD